MTFLKKLKKLIGILICIFAGFFGIASSIQVGEENFFAVLAMYTIIGILPFTIGMFLVKGKEFFHFKKSRAVEYRVYIWVTFTAPALLGAIEHYSKRNNSPELLYIDPLTQEWLGYLIVVSGMVAYYAAGRWFVAGWKNTETPFKWMLVFSLIFSLAAGLYTRNDYNAIEKDGLLLSPYGEKEKVSWEGIEYAEIDGYLSGGKDSDFEWRFYFKLRDGRTIDFGPFGYHTYGLAKSLEIKDLLKEKKIPWTVYNLTNKEWEHVKIDMDYEKDTDPEDFYAIFQYDRKKKEYYSIPFD